VDKKPLHANEVSRDTAGQRTNQTSRENLARCYLEGMLAATRRGENNTTSRLVRTLQYQFADTGWGMLGIYWYCLLARQTENIRSCERQLNKRTDVLDNAQRKFYQRCLHGQQALQSDSTVPTGGAPTQISLGSNKRALDIHVIEYARFQARIESEFDEENRKVLGALAGLKSKKVLNGVRPEVFDSLRHLQRKQPNMVSAIELIRAELHARSLAGAPAKLPSILLCGGPGVGKTRFMAELALSMELPYTEIQVAGSPDAFKITGLSRFWNRAGPGLVARVLAESGVANPIFLFDEIDKAGRSEHGSPHDALLGLLEERTAREFRDAFIDVPMNVSLSSFIATANSIDTIPAPLLSRFVVLNIPDLTDDERQDVSRSIYEELRRTEPYGNLFVGSLHENVSRLLAQQEGFSPRLAKQLLRQGMQKACLDVLQKPQDRSLMLGIEHIRLTSSGKRHMGFVPG